MNVLEIIKEYLVQNGYDGLYNTAGECACLIEDLAPCSESCSDCEPGYKGPCLCGGDHDFDLTPNRPATIPAESLQDYKKPNIDFQPM